MSKRAFISKIKSPRSLATHLRKLKKSSKKCKVVFTNGCFDLLHKGHVSYLEAARKKGDLLVVALNGDASVRRLKGPTRPLNGLADRLEVIAALESVDFVTWFEEDTPLSVILALRPNVLVKGGDWNPEHIVGSTQVKEWGGRVFSLPYIKGKSTTRIIARAARQ